MYAILDDQSNRSLVSKEFFDFFEIESQPINYTMSTCSGQATTSGRKATGFIVEPFYLGETLEFPELLETNCIPNHRDEIPDPKVIRKFKHLKNAASTIPNIGKC